MKSRVLINDTAEATFTRISDGHKVLMHETQLASLSQTVSEEKLKGGIGNGTIALLRTDKEMELSVRNALWDAEYLAMTQGTVFTDAGDILVTKKYRGTVTATGALDALEIKVEDTEGKPVTSLTATGTVIADEKGQFKDIAIDAGIIDAATDLATLAAGDKVEILVEEKVAAGSEVATFDSKKFGEKYRAEYFTIAYDPDTMEVVQNIYIIFDEVVPSGNFDMSFENGTAMTPEINFTVTNPKGSSVLGRIVREDATV